MTQHQNAIEHACQTVAAGFAGTCLFAVESMDLLAKALSVLVLLVTLIWTVIKIRKELRKKE